MYTIEVAKVKVPVFVEIYSYNFFLSFFSSPSLNICVAGA